MADILFTPMGGSEFSGWSALQYMNVKLFYWNGDGGSVITVGQRCLDIYLSHQKKSIEAIIRIYCL